MLCELIETNRNQIQRNYIIIILIRTQIVRTICFSSVKCTFGLIVFSVIEKEVSSSCQLLSFSTIYLMPASSMNKTDYFHLFLFINVFYTLSNSL